jgi:von Willebrand factor type A domain-containing protein
MRHCVKIPRISLFAALAGLSATAGISCSSTSDDGAPPAQTDPKGGASSTSGAAGVAGGGGQTGGRDASVDPPDLDLPAGGVADGGGGDSAVCDAQVREGQRVPVDMYFLVDSSGSMDDEVAGGSKWDVISNALIGFLEDPRSAGTGAGIGYFPVDTGSCTSGQPGCFCIPLINLCISTQGGACEASDYSTPAVELALPAQTATIVDDIRAHDIGGGTPTRPALEGALGYVSGWASQHPERKAVLVLATDGEPVDCDQNTPQDAADVAASALSGPNQIRTFVIGVGSSLVNLNLVAQAGGTDHAFLVDTGGDVAKEFADALDAIRGAAASCDFSIPDASSGAEPVDPTKVNVSYIPNGSTTPTRVLQTSMGDPSNCDSQGGWYYDDPTSPTTIKLCDATCQALSTGSIQVEFGCDTVEQPPR